ncbi:MAG TPA: IS110 family transposase [Candidatus Bathyarchaeia archaeon]|nr:IS110 family transposase [Candidatus Bathyarchaeia archaeon]
MKKTTRFLGLDVHADTIAVAIAEPGGEVRSLGTIPNRAESVRRLVKRLAPPKTLRACYEAGPCGYVLYWQLSELGVTCEVIAPTLTPVKPGERVKTDRRDAEKLARSYRSGDLTAVWVPDRAHEALRDLVRARLCAKRDEVRHRHRLQRLLLRHGRHRPAGMGVWTAGHLKWLRQSVRFEEVALELTRVDYLHEVERARERIERLDRAIDEVARTASAEIRALIEGLQALRGMAKISAATIAVEVGVPSRFRTARQLMGYAGLVPCEHSSGSRVRRGAITKTGNAHLRRILIEAAWAYRHRPAVGPALRRRQQGLSEELKAIGWKAQHRLYGRYRHLVSRGKSHQNVVTSIARELAGFVWAMAAEIERQRHEPRRPAPLAA